MISEFPIAVGDTLGEFRQSLRSAYKTRHKKEPGGYFPVKGYWGCTAGWGSHFHNWIDYNGVIFLVELLEWGRTFSGISGVRKFW